MEQNTCSICLEEETEAGKFVSLGCHAFHPHCIRQWIVEQGRDDCPVCRGSVATNTMIDFYKKELDFVGRLICCSVDGKKRMQAFQSITRAAMKVAVEMAATLPLEEADEAIPQTRPHPWRRPTPPRLPFLPSMRLHAASRAR